jgi:hypothetical protein
MAISDAGCDPATVTVPPGTTTFDVTNQGSSEVTGFAVKQAGKTLGEVENVEPGSPKKLTVTLKQGSYTMRCPNGTTAEEGTLDVTGSRSTTTCVGPGQGGEGGGGNPGTADVADDGSVDGTQSGCITGTNSPSGSIAPTPGGNGGGVQPGGTPSPNVTTAP